MDIDDITIKYLSNLKNKSHKLNAITINEEDITFYKHRIQNLTYELLNNIELVNIDTDIKQAFNIYVHSCIQYFKLVDTNMIIQKDHIPGIPIVEDTLCGQPSTGGGDNPAAANSNPVKQLNYIDKFVIRNKMNKTKLLPNIIIPKQKDVNIKTSELRYKIDIPTVSDEATSLDMILPHDYFFYG